MSTNTIKGPKKNSIMSQLDSLSNLTIMNNSPSFREIFHKEKASWKLRTSNSWYEFCKRQSNFGK